MHEGLPYGDHKVSFAIDLDRVTYFGEASSSSSQGDREEDENKRSKSRNQQTLSNHGKEKGDVEFAVLLDGRFDRMPLDWERSSLLVEKLEEVNIGDGENVRRIHLAKSPQPKEK